MPKVDEYIPFDDPFRAWGESVSDKRRRNRSIVIRNFTNNEFARQARAWKGKPAEPEKEKPHE